MRSATYRFDAPVDWTVTRTMGTTSVAKGEQLVSVTVFRLGRPFRPAFWNKVVPQLDRVASRLATQLGGTVRSRASITVAARRARSYDIAYKRDGKNVTERIDFMLDGRSEYQLLCRFAGDDSPCKRFVASFALV